MKKKVIITISSFFLFFNVGFSQVAPVYDAANNTALLTQFVTTLTELYEMYDQTMNQIQMIQQNYEQMQYYLERAKTWDFKEVQWDGDLDFRNEIMDATSQVNRQLNNIRGIRNSLTTKNISIDGKTSYSLLDLVHGEPDHNIGTFVQNGFDYYSDGLAYACKVWSEGVPEDEAEFIWAQYGLNPANYKMVREVEKKLNEKYELIIGQAEEDLQQQNSEYKKSYQIIENIMNMVNADAATEGELLQANALLLQQVCYSVKDLAQDLQQGVGYMAWYNKYQDQKKESEEQSRKERMIEESGNHLPDYF